MEINIPILSGSNFDLTKFDFSFKDIKIYDIQSEEFDRYIESIQPDHKDINLKYFCEIREKIRDDYEKKYAIIKNKPKDNFSFQDIYNVWKLLLIIFPSDLLIECSIDYLEEDGFTECISMTSWGKRLFSDNPVDILIGLDKYVPEINEFIKLCFDRLSNDSYLGIAIENYLTSFTASHLIHRYLTLCIALECLIYGDKELTYRLRRTIAILCGKDVFNCDIIYDNINKLYSLRSKIIHGEKYDINLVLEYLKPLQAIVSRSLVELLIHNVKTNEELNKIITKLGFGDRAKISQSWKSYELNIRTIVDSNWTKLK